MTQKAQRLQVFLSHNGVCSRRQAMDIIKAGRVAVNGQEEREPSRPIDPSKDKVSVDGKDILFQNYQYILLNKPKGYVCTKAEFKGERSILELLPAELRYLSPVGRLDKDTEGLLLLTNDGDLAFRLTHPKFNVDKTYVVRVTGKLKEEDKVKLERGIVVEDRKTAPAKIESVKFLTNQSEFLMTIHEGRKRQIRIMLGTLKYPVVYLKRISQGPLVLGDLAPGTWRVLTLDEINGFKKLKI